MINYINHIADYWFNWHLAMLWQITILIAIVAAVDLAIKRWTWPQLRYALWLLILVKLILPPTLTSPASFTSNIPLLAEKTVKIDFTRQQAVPKPAETATLPEIVPPMPAEIVTETTETSISPLPQAEQPTSPPPANLSLKFYAMAVWLLGIAILSTWLVVRLKNLRKENLSNPTNKPLPERFQQLLKDTAGKLKLKTIPKVILTKKVSCPAVFGLFKPVLLMPADKLSSMSRQDTEHILLHELAHIKRGDLIVHAVYMVLQIAYWFNPLLWLIRKQLQNLRELCCDATVAKILKEKTHQYRQTLLETARQLLAQPIDPGLGLLGLFENSNWLLDRLKWLEKKTWKNRPLRIVTIFILVCLMATCVIPMAKFDPGPPCFVIKGTVTDAETGRPIAGAKVGDNKKYNDGKCCTVTDSNGNYEYKTWYEEHGTIAEADGYKSQLKGFNTKLFGSEKEKVIDFELTPEKVAEQSEFKAILPNGVTVEVLGVCEHPSEGKQWWRPDGSSLEEAPYDDDFGRAFPKYGEKGYKFAVKYSSLAGKDVDARVIPTDFKTTNGGTFSWTSEKNGKENTKYVERLLDEKIVWLGAAFDEKLGHCDIRIGVCWGDWKSDYRYKTDRPNDIVEWVEFKNVSLKPNFKTEAQLDEKKQILKQAEEQARLLNHEYIGTEHILLALVAENSGIVSGISKKFGITREQIYNEILRLIKKGKKIVYKKTLPMTARAKLAIKNADQWAKALNSDTVKTQHVLLGLLQVEDGVGAQVLMNLGLNLEKAQETITHQSGQVERKKSKNENLQAAIANGDIDEAKKLIEEGADVNMQGKEGRTPLRWAVDAGYKKIVELLIKNSADVSIPDDYGATLLHITGTKPKADTAKYLEIAGILIANGADVNANKNRANRTPLHVSSKYGNKELVELLIANGATVDAKDTYGKTPLLLSECIYKGVAEILINNGADIAVKDKNGQTPLHLAANWGHVDIVKLFLDKGADINAMDNNGLTPLDYATKKKYWDTIKLLKANAGYSATELENSNLKKVFLPDVDEKPVMLDLASGQLIDLPEPVTGKEVLATIDKLDEGDIIFDTATLIFVRGASSNSSIPHPKGAPVKTYKIPANELLPKKIIVTSRSSQQYELNILSVDKKGCQLEYYPLDQSAGQVEGQASAVPVVSKIGSPSDVEEIIGKVIDAKDQGVSGAIVFSCDQNSGIPISKKTFRVFTEDFGQQNMNVVTAMTDDNGAFFFENIPNGRYRLVAQSWPDAEEFKGALEVNGKEIELHGIAEDIQIFSGDSPNVVLRPLGTGILQIDEKMPNDETLVVISTEPTRADPILGFAGWSGQFMQNMIGGNRMPSGKTTIYGLPEGKIYLAMFAADSVPGWTDGEVYIQANKTTVLDYIQFVNSWSNSRHDPPKQLEPVYKEVKQLVIQKDNFLFNLYKEYGLLEIDSSKGMWGFTKIIIPHLAKETQLPSGHKTTFGEVLAAWKYVELQQTVERKKQRRQKRAEEKNKADVQIEVEKPVGQVVGQASHSIQEVDGLIVGGKCPLANPISLEKYKELKAEYIRKRGRPGNYALTYREKEKGDWRNYWLMLDGFDEHFAWVAEVTQYRSKGWSWLKRYRLNRNSEVDKELNIPAIIQNRSRIIGGVKYGMSVKEVLRIKGEPKKVIPHAREGSEYWIYDDVKVWVWDWFPEDKGWVRAVEPIKVTEDESSVSSS